ncbi:MAG: pilus assembly protein PilM [Gammaproteobacteria bacterium]|nr:pilus assembly protein PilM [Gammaproteobacteria bacterium]
MALFAFLNKKQKSAGLAGISQSEQGLAMAKILRIPDQKPVLQHCEFMLCEELEKNAKSGKLEKVPFTAVMPSGEFSMQLLDAPLVESAEMQTAVRWKIKDMIDYSLDDAIVDVFEIPGLKEKGRTPQVYAVYAHRNSVQSQVDLFENAGLNLQYIDIPELAQRNIASLLEEDEKGVALLRFNAQSGLITLTQQGTLYLARELDAGYQVLADLGVIPDQESTDFDAMESDAQRAMNAVVLEIQRSLDYYESHFAKAPITRLVIAPMEIEIPGLADYINKSLGLKVSMLDLNSIIQPDAPLDSKMQAQCFYAIGAALREE